MGCGKPPDDATSAPRATAGPTSGGADPASQERAYLHAKAEVNLAKAASQRPTSLDAARKAVQKAQSELDRERREGGDVLRLGELQCELDSAHSDVKDLAAAAVQAEQILNRYRELAIRIAAPDPDAVEVAKADLSVADEQRERGHAQQGDDRDQLRIKVSNDPRTGEPLADNEGRVRVDVFGLLRPGTKRSMVSSPGDRWEEHDESGQTVSSKEHSHYPGSYIPPAATDHPFRDASGKPLPMGVILIGRTPSHRWHAHGWEGRGEREPEGDST